MTGSIYNRTFGRDEALQSVVSDSIFRYNDYRELMFTEGVFHEPLRVGS